MPCDKCTVMKPVINYLPGSGEIFIGVSEWSEFATPSRKDRRSGRPYYVSCCTRGGFMEGLGRRLAFLHVFFNFVSRLLVPARFRQQISIAYPQKAYDAVCSARALLIWGLGTPSSEESSEEGLLYARRQTFA